MGGRRRAKAKLDWKNRKANHGSKPKRGTAKKVFRGR